jgi:K(+)-stimulated pyrophosphate-energized sodium pump
MGSTFLPMAIVVAAILGTYNLYGSYGTALASVALLTTLGVTAAAGIAGSILDTAGGIAEMARLPPATRALISSLRASANTAKAICRAYSTISAVFTAYALLLVLVQDSGQTASPRELLGGPRVISTRFLGDEHTSPLTSGFVVAAVLVGFMLPLLFSGLQLISVSRVAQKMIEEVWGQLRQYPGLLSSASVAQADHAKCLDIAGQSSIVELLLPGLSCILAPFIIGFGFGQQALIAMLLAAIGSGYALSMMMVHAGCGWEMAKLSIEDDADQARGGGASIEEAGKGGGGGGQVVGSGVVVPSSYDEAGVGSVAHRSAKAVDAVGDSFKDTVGSSLTVLTKLMTSFGLVSVSLMQSDETRGWIGAILLAVLAVTGTGLITWSSRRGKQQEQEQPQQLSISSLSSPPSPTSAAVAKDGGEAGAAAAGAAAASSSVVVVAGHYSEELAPRKTVSPFYAGGSAA